LREFSHGAFEKEFRGLGVAPSSPEEEKPDDAKVAAELERNCKNFLISMPRQPARLELIVIFEKAIRLETGFWKWAAVRIMGLNSWSVSPAIRNRFEMRELRRHPSLHLSTAWDGGGFDQTAI
jgi:hypothetical protein